MVVCVEDLARKKNSLVKFEGVHNRDMDSCSLMSVCYEEEVGLESKSLFLTSQKNRVNCLLLMIIIYMKEN